MTDLRALAEQVSTALSRLRLEWEQSLAVWDDRVRADIERNYWLPIEQHTCTNQQRMDELGVVVAEARQSLRSPWE